MKRTEWVPAGAPQEVEDRLRKYAMERQIRMADYRAAWEANRIRNEAPAIERKTLWLVNR